MINSIVYTNTSDRRIQGEIIMAFVKTADLVTKNDNTYATTDEFKAEHGLLGTENTNYITDSSITLNDAGTGVRIVLTYEKYTKKSSYICSWDRRSYIPRSFNCKLFNIERYFCFMDWH